MTMEQQDKNSLMLIKTKLHKVVLQEVQIVVHVMINQIAQDQKLSYGTEQKSNMVELALQQ